MIVSLFSGALGLDLGVTRGLQAALNPGHPALQHLHRGVTCELNRDARATIQAALPHAHHYRDVTGLHASDWADLPWAHQDGPDGGRPLLLLGGPPCQPFSHAGARGALNDPRGSLFMDYVRLIQEAQPRFFVMENVRGLLTAALRARPTAQRGPGFPPLSPEERPGSVFATVLAELQSTGYQISHGLMQAADYGAPQTRERLIILGSRDHEHLTLPAPTHARDGQGGLMPWVTVGQAWTGLCDPDPEFQRYSAKRARFYALIPPGGNWRDLPEELQPEAMGGAYRSGGGRVGYYRRLSLERPAPTLLTSPDQRSTGLGHPTELRPLSIAEYTCLQGFPADWPLQGALSARYRQVGNAVPVPLGEAIGRQIARTLISQTLISQTIQKTGSVRQAAD